RWAASSASAASVSRAANRNANAKPAARTVRKPKTEKNAPVPMDSTATNRSRHETQRIDRQPHKAEGRTRRPTRARRQPKPFVATRARSEDARRREGGHPQPMIRRVFRALLTFAVFVVCNRSL